MTNAVSWWGAVLALHILGAVIWVGGMFFAILVLRPSLGTVDPAPRIALLGQIFRKFFRYVWHVIPIMIVTGYAMVFGRFGGFRGVGWTVHAMQGLGWIMTFVFLAVVFGPYPKFRAAIQPAKAGQHVETMRRLIAANLVLGLVTIVVAALGSI